MEATVFSVNQDVLNAPATPYVLPAQMVIFLLAPPALPVREVAYNVQIHQSVWHAEADTL